MKMKLIILILVLMLTAPCQQSQELSDCDVLNGGLGSVDYDEDGVKNCNDNCVLDFNPTQQDTDADGYGDACEWREQQSKAWEEWGRQERQQAREPVDIAHLSAASTDIVLARFTDNRWIERKPGKPLVIEMEVLRRFKDSTSRRYQQYKRPMWVVIPDGGPPELDGEFILFLKNDTAKNWKKPNEWPAPLLPGVAPEARKDFRYELAHPWYGVLGVSPQRLIEIEKIVKAQRKRGN
jgi:hypothetical protein